MKPYYFQKGHQINKGMKFPNRKRPSPFTTEHLKRMSEAQMGHSRGGWKLSEETKKKIGLNGFHYGMLGKKFSEESKRKLSIALKGKNIWMKGRKLSQETKKKIGEAGEGRIPSEETRLKISKSQSGKNHWNWQDGLSRNKYPKEFNPTLKLKIRTRDNFTCVLCKRTEREELEELNRVLCVNHINFNKQNCKEENLNTLCLRCNVKINREREFYTNYFNQQ